MPYNLFHMMALLIINYIFFVWGLGFFGVFALGTLRGELHRVLLLLELETF